MLKITLTCKTLCEKINIIFFVPYSPKISHKTQLDLKKSPTKSTKGFYIRSKRREKESERKHHKSRLKRINTVHRAFHVNGFHQNIQSLDRIRLYIFNHREKNKVYKFFYSNIIFIIFLKKLTPCCCGQRSCFGCC